MRANPAASTWTLDNEDRFDSGVMDATRCLVGGFDSRAARWWATRREQADGRVQVNSMDWLRVRTHF